MPISSKLFGLKTIGLSSLIFLVIFLLLQRTILYICPNIIEFDCPWYFPISIFLLRHPQVSDVMTAATMLAAFILFIRWLERNAYDIRFVFVLSFFLIVGTTLIQGVGPGFYTPVAGDYRAGTLVENSPDGQEYYHDAIKVDDPIAFIRDHNRDQLTLHQHGKTHPPGPILFYYLLYQVLHDPGAISIAICFIASLLSVFGLQRLYAHFFDEPVSQYLAFVFMLLPAVQIYYLSTIDAVITGLLIVVLALFVTSDRWINTVLSGIVLAAAFFLTLVCLFILPVLVGFEVLTQRSIRRSTIVMAILAAVYLGLYLFLDYNVVVTFRTASHFENPNGFMLLHDTANYFFTRLEDISEILLFFGPFLFLLMFRGIRNTMRPDAKILFGLGVSVLLVMFLTGAFRTGETARACSFIYPFLLLPVGSALEKIGPGPPERLQLALLVFLQAVIMQCFGFYMW